ncbi:hypothetical protein BGP_0473 [Beggiatoa sp. PS]|nr:hypothetical protein BGP_0473 [Beggiatoa sp. PS]
MSTGGITMSNIGEFQDKVKNTLGPSFNFQIDKPHDGKPVHVDLTTVIPNIGGADKVGVDFNGNIIDGSTHIGPQKIKW